MKKERPVNHQSNLWRIAWQTYKASGEYAGAVRAMVESGMKQPYIDNILFLAFAAGYHAIR